jgi:hypothetical protein
VLNARPLSKWMALETYSYEGSNREEAPFVPATLVAPADIHSEPDLRQTPS